MSTQPCGCDSDHRTGPWVCEWHRNNQNKEERLASEFGLKDSGERMQFLSGMQRDTSAGKPDFTLVFDGPMVARWAEHLTKGAVKYTARNWMQASGPEELERFRQSAARHFVQWLRGDMDEDHAAAVFFNINGVEYVKERMQVPQPPLQMADPLSGLAGCEMQGRRTMQEQQERAKAEQDFAFKQTVAQQIEAEMKNQFGILCRVEVR